MLEAGAAFMKLGRAAATKHLGEKDGSITIELIGYLFLLLLLADEELKTPISAQSDKHASQLKGMTSGWTRDSVL